MHAINSKYTGFLYKSITLLSVIFLASCSCSSNAPIRDLIVPEITSTTPSSSAKNSVINTFINITFSEKMNEASINNNTFQLIDNNGQLVKGTIAFSGTSVTLKPEQALSKNTKYQAKLSRQVKDVAGNQIISDYLWQFTTGIKEDESSPTVDTVFPEPYTVDIPLNTIISISLTEIISTSSVSETSFIITDSENVKINGSYTVDDRTMTFKPDQELNSDTKYIVTLTTDIQDLAGNGLAFDYITQFTTLKNTDTNPPLVKSISPANNAVDIPPNANIIVSFSEDLDETSVNSDSLLIVDSNGQNISGNITLSGANIIFEPVLTLANNRLYTVTIDTGITDLFGNNLESPFIWRFTTGSNNDNTSPTVTYINPENNASNVANNNAITLTFSEEINPFTLTTLSKSNIQLKNNSSLVDVKMSYSGNTVILRPLSLLADNSKYTVSIIANITDLAGNKMQQDYAWGFTTGVTPDRDIPTVTSVYPENLTQNVAINSAIVARFSEPMDPGSIHGKSITVVDEAGNSIIGVMKTIGASVTFRPLQALAFSTNYTVTINRQATDLATNAIKDPYIWQFSTSTEEDTISPTIISTVPASSSNFAPTNRGLIVTFSEIMDLESINSATFYMTDTSGNIISGNIQYAGNTVTLMPNENLKFSQSYVANVSADVSDMSGNKLGLIHTWSFTTSAEIDTTPPTISSTFPGDGALAINSTVIALNFDKNMDTVSFNTANIKLYDANNQLIVGTISGTNTQALFSPVNILDYDSNFRVIVSTGIRDLASNNLAEDYSWTFKTSLPPDLAPPFVVAITPLNNQEKVELVTTLQAVFSEAINCSTVNNANFTLSQDIVLIPGTTSCNENVIYFTPTDALITENNYTVKIDTSVQDMQLTGLTEIYRWQFSTAPWTQVFGSVSIDTGNAIAVDDADNVYTAGTTSGNLAGLNMGNTDVFVTKHSKNSLLLWSKQFGSSDGDTITGIVTDDSGNTYLSGYSYGDFASTNFGGADIIIFKLDNLGNLIWKKQYGTNQDDVASAIKLDNNSDLILAGYSFDDFDGNLSQGLHDVIVLKLSSVNGALNWSQQFGSVAIDVANDVLVDSTNSVYVTGYTQGDIAGTGLIGSSDIFIAKLDNNGVNLWVKQIGTVLNDRAQAMAIDSNDNIYLTGFTTSALDNNTHFGAADQFVLKYDTSGVLLTSSQFGSDDDDRAFDIIVDNADNIILSGYTLGLMGDVNSGDFDLTLIKVDSNITQQWIQQYGSASSDLSFSLTYDSNDNLYLTGQTEGELDGNKNAGSFDVFITKWNTDGTKQ